MPRTLRAIIICTSALTAVWLSAPGFAQTEAQPSRHPVTIANPKITLSDALGLIEKQTGNSVANTLTADPILTLDIKRASFWPALDAVAKAADARISLYHSDGIIALSQGGYRAMPVDYQEQFRTTIKRVEVSRNLESKKTLSRLYLDVAWEPRFEPLYLGVGKSAIAYATGKVQKIIRHKAPGGAMINVAKRKALELRLSYPAAPRSSLNIAISEGEFKVIGPKEMLSFSFDRLEPFKDAARARAKKRENVEVKLTRLVASTGRWSFDIVIRKPAGNVEFESFQSWMGNNQIMLVKSDGVKTTAIHPKSEDEELLEPETATGVAVRYHFVESDGKRLGKLGDWQLVYRTPGDIVEFHVPFRFQDIPLP